MHHCLEELEILDSAMFFIRFRRRVANATRGYPCSACAQWSLYIVSHSSCDKCLLTQSKHFPN